EGRIGIASDRDYPHRIDYRPCVAPRPTTLFLLAERGSIRVNALRMATSAFGRRVSWRSVTGLLIACAFMAFLVTQAPHLVHHFFDPELVQDECPFAANGDRTGGLQIEPLALLAASARSRPAL